MIDLFGNNVSDNPTPRRGVKLLKFMANYRLALSKEQSCKTCKNLIQEPYNGKNYYKCQNFGSTNGSATDITLKSTCNNWEAKK